MIKIFADGADIDDILALCQDPRISGFTTNPTLMRKAGVVEYQGFARKVLDHVTDLPVCFEVFSDDVDEMRRQAHLIDSWGANVYVKIPVTNTAGESTAPLVEDLSRDGLRLNVTAMLSLVQVETVAPALTESRGAILSVFAGRIADTGRDPVPLMVSALQVSERYPAVELLWASPREVLNLRQAESIGCDIITMTRDLLAKISGLDRDLDAVSLETVRMFHDDAAASGYVL